MVSCTQCISSTLVTLFYDLLYSFRSRHVIVGVRRELV